MAATHQFFPSWRLSIRWGLSAAIGVVLLAVAHAYVSAGPKADVLRNEPAFETQMAFLLLLFVIAAAAFTLMRRFPAVRVTAEGVFAARGSGFRSRLVRWDEIARVIPSSMYGLRFLVLVTSNPFPEQLRMLMHLDELSMLRDFVAAQAGKEHPLTLWLSAAHLATNKSPRARRL